MEYKRIAVGTAENPHRCMINHSSLPQSAYDDGALMDVEGWKHHMDFWAFTSQAPGTVRIAVGTADAGGPSRAFLNHPSQPQEYWDAGNSMETLGWQHHSDFWVFPTQQPGTIRVCVGHLNAEGGHRIFLNHPVHDQSTWNDGNVKMDVEGFEHYLEFWAYPSKPQ